jgi:hypothetical protein
VASESFKEDHILLTEQDQGNIMEKLEDPETVERLMRGMKHSGMGETLADRIVRESLEARAVRACMRGAVVCACNPMLFNYRLVHHRSFIKCLHCRLI